MTWGLGDGQTRRMMRGWIFERRYMWIVTMVWDGYGAWGRGI